ncbi:phage terminase small subunit [Enterococcus avium]|uniref:Phage terminase small subunit n=1 Tax=Enterococcus avium TaxID=33945 RepID=A0AAW8RXF3_ENTAV|nr:phage terminase small subunit [Enterococcus avium]MDT2403893.1 phage terminase small subunit [Enterococcus avium]
MARQRNPLRDEAYKLWIDSDKKKPLKDIAEELGVSASTVRKWKSEDKWDGDKKRSAPNQKERYDSMHGNQNAKGNPGGKPPPNNKNAVSHGLFANWLPDETLEIMNEVATSKPEDILWNNIMIQYTAIIRAQKIMYVYDGDLSKEVSKWSSSESGSSEEYAIQYAWDKQANFMNAQSRAMSTLANLIKQFVSIADEQDERRKKLELMNTQVDLAKAQLKQLDDGYDPSEEQTVIIDDVPIVESEVDLNGDESQDETSD